MSLSCTGLLIISVTILCLGLCLSRTTEAKRRGSRARGVELLAKDRGVRRDKKVAGQAVQQPEEDVDRPGSGCQGTNKDCKQDGYTFISASENLQRLRAAPKAWRKPKSGVPSKSPSNSRKRSRKPTGRRKKHNRERSRTHSQALPKTFPPSRITVSGRDNGFTQERRRALQNKAKVETRSRNYDHDGKQNKYKKMKLRKDNHSRATIRGPNVGVTRNSKLPKIERIIVHHSRRHSRKLKLNRFLNRGQKYIDGFSNNTRSNHVNTSNHDGDDKYRQEIQARQNEETRKDYQPLLLALKTPTTHSEDTSLAKQSVADDNLTGLDRYKGGLDSRVRQRDRSRSRNNRRLDRTWPRPYYFRNRGRTRGGAIRPTEKNQWDQQVNPDLNRSYRHLMELLHGLMQKMSDSVMQLNANYDEMHTEARDGVMMGVREVYDDLHEAGGDIIDGMNKLSQFTRQLYLKAHKNRAASRSGKVKDEPIVIPKSNVDNVDFRPQRDQAYGEKRESHGLMMQADDMKRKSIRGDSRVDQVNEQFDFNYDRPAIGDLFYQLNSTIFRVSNGWHKSAHLQQLERRKLYMDVVEEELQTAKYLMWNSTNFVRSGLSEFEEVNQLYEEWIRRRSLARGRPGDMQNDQPTLTKSVQKRNLKRLVTEAKRHAYDLENQRSRAQSLLAPPMKEAKLLLETRGKMVSALQLKLLAKDLNQLVKDMVISLDALRLHIGSETKIVYKKPCIAIRREGSGEPREDDDSSNDDEDSTLCEEEGSGMDSLDSSFIIDNDDEDFVFDGEPVDDRVSHVQPISQFGIDVFDYTTKILVKSKEFFSKAEQLQAKLADLKERWKVIQTNFAVIERTEAEKKELIRSMEKSARDFQGVKARIRKIHLNVETLKMFDLEEVVDRATHTVDWVTKHSNIKPTGEKQTGVTDKPGKSGETTDEDDSFSFTSLIRKGLEIESNRDDITLLKSMAIESCHKMGSRYNQLRGNVSLLRQKVEMARKMLTSLQMSISKSGTGHIPIAIPQVKSQLPDDLSFSTSIRTCIKPKTLDGSILLVEGNVSNSYEVSLYGGQLSVTTYDKDKYDLGSITLDGYLEQEKWYTLEITRTDQTLNVSMIAQDGSVQQKAEHVDYLVPIQPRPLWAYVGGVPDKLGIGHGSWEGCIGQLSVDGMMMHLFGPDSEGKEPKMCTDHCGGPGGNLSMVFGGNGFVHFERPAIETVDSVRLRFKTRQESASLLSVMNKNQRFLLSVAMSKGALRVESKGLVANDVLISLKHSLNDGKFHSLKVMFRGGKAYPELDGNKEAFSVEAGNTEGPLAVQDGVVIGAFVSTTRKFINSHYRPLVGCVQDVFLNDAVLVASEAQEIYNVYRGHCQDSQPNLWHSCWNWTIDSSAVSLGEVADSNKLSMRISTLALGPVLHYAREEVDIEVSLTEDGIEVTSENPETFKGVMLRPDVCTNPFILITVVDEGTSIDVKAWDQSVSVPYGETSIWFSSSADLTVPHTVVLGRGLDDDGRSFIGSLAQFTVGNRFYDLSSFTDSHNLQVCNKAKEQIVAKPQTQEEQFTCQI